MQARQRLDRDLFGEARLDDLLAHAPRRRRDRDQHLVRLVVAQEVLEVVGRAEHLDAVDAVASLARVVVDEADRRVVQLAVALQLADHQLPGISGADDQHLLAVGDEAGRRALDQRAGQQARSGDEREQQEVVERGDTAREARGVRGRERVEDEVRDRRGRGDAAKRAPHVARRDVAPPAVVEAEEHERREVDRDDERDHLPVEQVPVEDRRRLVEAQEERQLPRGDDQDRIERKLPDPVSIDREAHQDADEAGSALEDGDDLRLLLLGDPGPQRQAEILARRLLGLREVALGVAEVPQRRLQMQRRLVVRGEADPGRLQRRGEPVALGRPDAVHVVDVARLVDRRLDETGQQLGVARGSLTPRSIPVLDMPQEDAQERRLHRIEPRVVADVEELLLRCRAVEAEHPDALRELRVVDGDQAAVAESEEVLRREEAERRRDARRDAGCAERLRGVLDHRQAEAAEVGRGAAEEMHRHDRLRALGDPALDVGGVEVERHRVDLREDRGGATARDRLGGRVERERRADHLVAGADPHRIEDEHERVGAVCAADGVERAEQRSRLALERLDLRPEDEAAGLERARECLLQLRDQRRVLRLDVNVGNRHRRVKS